jgi:hypothetical protein
MAMNKAWFTAALIAATLLAWLELPALDGSLARAEPKTLRYKILHAAARITRGARRRQLKIQASWPWAADIAAAWNRISVLASAPRQAQHVPCPSDHPPQGQWNPGHLARQPGRCHASALKSRSRTRPAPQPPPADQAV